MQCDSHALVNLFVDAFEAVIVYLAFVGTRRAVVAVYVANRRGKNVDSGIDKIVDVFEGGEERCLRQQ